MSEYMIIIETGEDGGFGAYAPDLPGVVAVADTYDECVSLMREAVEFHLEGMRMHGEEIPVPSIVGAEKVITAA